MSPLYLPMKRKSVHSSKPGPVQRVPQSISEPNTEYTKNDFGPDAATTHMNGTKRFEELQSVPLSSLSYPSPSCSSGTSSGMSSCLTDGTCPGFTSPSVVPKVKWTTPEPTTRGQSWGCTQDQSSEPWGERSEAWGCEKVQTEGQGEWSSRGDGAGVEKKWRPDGGAEGGWCQGVVPGREEGWREQPSVCGSVLDGAALSSVDHKPAAVPVKKEAPVFSPGSPEEGWQAQIVSRGRVTCPRCRSVSRKTVEGLKKHLDNCRLEPFICPHCGKQLKSSTGMKYHIMADHSLLPSSDAKDLDERAIKEKLRKILKKLGKLKCSQEGCRAAFTSIVGYFYHRRTCGKAPEELEKMALRCSLCGRTYRSKAGLVYHLKNEHAPVTVKTEEDELQPLARPEETPERTASGRVQRASAQVANLQLAHIAHNDPPKDWDKRKFSADLVPDDKKLKYTRPGLPAFSQEVLRRWRSEVKLHKKVHCPNQGCGSTYTSVSGLKSHLGLCTKGQFEAGKYRCLICNKEFNSESGVKYHITSVHAQDWFVTNKKACKKFKKLLKTQPKDFSPITDQHQHQHQHQHHCHQNQTHFHHFHHFHHHANHIQPLHHLQPQNYFIYPENHPIPPQTDPKMDHEPPPAQYTPLQPVWGDERLTKHQEDVKMMDPMRDRSRFEFANVREDSNNTHWR